MGAGYDGKLEACRCLPPTPSITMKVTTFGIHARLSYLYHGGVQRMTVLPVSGPGDYTSVPPDIRRTSPGHLATRLHEGWKVLLTTKDRTLTMIIPTVSFK